MIDNVVVMFDDSSIATYNTVSSSTDNQYGDAETILGSFVKSMLIFLLSRWKLLFVSAIFVGAFVMNEVTIRRRRAQQQTTGTGTAAQPAPQQPQAATQQQPAQRPHQD